MLESRVIENVQRGVLDFVFFILMCIVVLFYLTILRAILCS